MASRKRMEGSWLQRMALPVLSGSIIRPGQRIHVISPVEDPRFLEELPKSVYGILEPFELAPTFFNDFLDIEHVSDEEVRSLGQILGAELTDQAREDLGVAIERFVSAIALADGLPAWNIIKKDW